jgi:hypothetical protein
MFFDRGVMGLRPTQADERQFPSSNYSSPGITDRLRVGMLIAFARNFDRNQTGIVIGFIQEC